MSFPPYYPACHDLQDSDQSMTMPSSVSAVGNGRCTEEQAIMSYWSMLVASSHAERCTVPGAASRTGGGDCQGEIVATGMHPGRSPSPRGHCIFLPSSHAPDYGPIQVIGGMEPLELQLRHAQDLVGEVRFSVYLRACALSSDLYFLSRLFSRKMTWRSTSEYWRRRNRGTTCCLDVWSPAWNIRVSQGLCCRRTPMSHSRNLR